MKRLLLTKLIFFTTFFSLFAAPVASGSATNTPATLTEENLITLPATQEPNYQIYLSEPDKTVLDEITIVFEDEDPVNNFYTDGQDNLYMHIGLDIDGSTQWEQVQSFTRNDDADNFINEAISTKVQLSITPEGKFSSTIDPVKFFSRIPSGSMVKGIHVLVVNKYDDSANNKTEDLYIDLTDAIYYTTYLTPEKPTASQQVVVTFNAKATPLEGTSKVYFHSGIATDAPNSTSFSTAVGNWGQDDGVGEMTRKPGKTDIWELTITNIEEYYNLSETQDAFTLNCLFRSEDGSVKEDDINNDNYHLELDPGNFFLIDKPDFSPFLTQKDILFDIEATSSTNANWTLIETDENGQVIGGDINTQNTNASYVYQHTVTDVNDHYYKLTADFGDGDVKFKTFSVSGYSDIVVEAKPEGTQNGINYYYEDDTKVTLVLHTPTSTNYKKGTGAITGYNTTAPKNVVHLLWDESNWNISENYKMKRDGDYWWITIDSLIPGKEYVFQYLIDGQLRIADPYTRKVSESNDQWISTSTYPDLIQYPADKTFEIASVFQTAEPEYNWQVNDFNRPLSNNLNIYELHFRDFTEEGTYKAATAKLDYLEELGINCIHVMPVSEFEGNDSWGYNPNYYFALDKAYGTENDLKEFIDEAHEKGIAVVNDLVLNHAFHSNVMARMYWNSTDNKPANDNPWFNPDHKAVYDQAGHWGADWNHESEHTQNMVDDILDYWISEFRFDGFRFDFTKGFTQTAPDSGDPWASSYDQDRIDLLKRMVNNMWANHPGTYAIFEHLANDDEDRVLADHGILMWSGAGPQHPYKNLALGYTGSGDYSMWSSVFHSRNFQYANYVSYIESHDEERLGYYVSQWANGISGLTGDAKTEYLIKRLKMVSAFNALLPGPRMLWQFEELGYDISINYNGRTGAKPVHWEYFDDPNRKQLYRLYSLILNMRNTYNLYATEPDYGNIGYNDLTTPRRMSLYDGNGKKVIVIANFDTENWHEIYPEYSNTGTWYKYNGDPAVDGTTYTVNSTGDNYNLAPSEFFILTNFDAKKRNQTISFEEIPDKTYGDDPFELSATTDAPGLTITYESSNTDVATVSGNMVTIVCAGTTNITAKQEGNEYYEAAQDVTQTLVVNPNVVCQDITVQLDATGNAVITAEELINGTNTCGIVSMTVEPNSFNCENVGANEVVLTATDVNGNSSQCAAVVTVINDTPVIDEVTANSVDPMMLGTTTTLNISYTDINAMNVNVAWGDEKENDYAEPSSPVTATHTYANPGVYTIIVTVTDVCGLTAEYIYKYAVIYDPDGGFVTGGGWINSPEGAYVADPTLSGKADFGFVAKYKKGKTTPDGNTKFQFKAGDLNFKSVDYEWLVNAGSKTMFKGTGIINGNGNYGFMLSAIDAELTNSATTDKFRIKIWNKDNGDALVYDNNFGTDEAADPATEIGGGSIVIHSGKIKNKSAEIVSELSPEAESANLLVYPNPFNERLLFEFTSPEDSHARIDIYDISGKLVKNIFNQNVEESVNYIVDFVPDSHASQMYFYRLIMDEEVFNGKVTYKK